MIERWLPVVGFDGRYEVSDLGRVRRVPHTAVDRRGYRLTWGPLILKPKLRRGYLRVALPTRWGRVNRCIHILVLEAFVGQRPPGMEARHLNGDRSDSRLVNLTWGTHAENYADKVRHGTDRGWKRGERAGLHA